MGKEKKVKGVMDTNGIIYYFEDQEDFREAWPGLALMIQIQKGNFTNPAYKGVDTNGR